MKKFVVFVFISAFFNFLLAQNQQILDIANNFLSQNYSKDDTKHFFRDIYKTEKFFVLPVFTKDFNLKKSFISFFIFKNLNDFSDFIFYPNVYEFNSLGLLPTNEDISYYPIVDSILITFRIDKFTDSFSATNLVCIYYREKAPEVVGEFYINYSDKMANKSEYKEWFSTVNMIERTGTLPDFLLYIQGKENGSYFQTDKCYVFDGEKYVIK